MNWNRLCRSGCRWSGGFWVLSGVLLVLLFIVGAAPGWTSDLLMPCPDGESATVSDEAGEFMESLLDLETAKRLALAGNPTMDAIEARVRQAESGIRLAASAWWPTVQISGSASRQWLSKNEKRMQMQTMQLLDPSASISDPEDYYQAKLGATWVVFNGFRRQFSVASSRYGRMETEAAWLDARRLLLSGVAGLYYSVQLERENIEIARADIAYNQRLLEEAKVRRQVGTAALSEELNFQIRVNAALTQLYQAERRFRVARLGLAAIMGLPDATLPDHVQLAPMHEEDPSELQMPDGEAALEYGLTHRPDLKQKTLAVHRGEANVGVARSEYYPTVALFGDVSGVRGNSAAFDSDDFGKQVGVQLSYPLFNGFARKARVDLARSEKEEAEKMLEQVRITVAEEINSALVWLEEAQLQVALQRENALLVERTRDLVEEEYNAGQTSLVRLNEAQRDLITAQGNLAMARVGLRRAWSALEEATGKILASFVEEG